MRRALILLPPLLAVFFAPSPGHAASFCDGHAYVSLGTQLLRFDPTSGATTPVRELPDEINAIAAHGDALYAIADPGGRAIKLAADGAIVDIGQLPRFNGAYIATAHDGSWLVLHDDVIHRIGLERRSVIERVPLRAAVRLGDWAADRDGRLLTLSTHGSHTALVAIDPRTGQVSPLAEPSGLPVDSVFGAIWLHGNDLYAWHNTTNTIYAVGLTAPGTARLVRAGLPPSNTGGGLDAAACEPTPAPALSPSLSPSPTPSLSPSSSLSPSLPPSPSLSPSEPTLPAVSPVTMATPAPAATVAQPAPPPTPPARPTPRTTAGPRPVPALRHRMVRSAAERKEEKTPHRHIAVAAGVFVLAVLLSLRGNGVRRGR